MKDYCIVKHLDFMSIKLTSVNTRDWWGVTNFLLSRHKLAVLGTDTQERKTKKKKSRNIQQVIFLKEKKKEIGI